jgi:hypothetical protein
MSKGVISLISTFSGKDGVVKKDTFEYELFTPSEVFSCFIESL